MRHHVSAIKTYATYEPKEIFGLFVYGLVIGFILSYNKWGANSFDAMEGLQNFFYYTLVALLILFSTTFVQKILGAHTGIIPTFQTSFLGLIVPLIFVFLTNGNYPFFIPPGFLTHEEIARLLGRNRTRRGFSDYLMLGMAGVFFLVIMALLFSLSFMQNMFVGVNTALFLYALYSLIPFDFILRPYDKTVGVSNASGIFYHSRTIYVFALLFLLCAYLLSAVNIFFLAILLSVLIAFVLALLYFLYEHKIFK